MNLPSSSQTASSQMLTESPLRDLEAIVRSRTPLIAMESNEEPQIDAMMRNLVGLTATDARRLAYKAINDDGVISESEMPEVMRAKYGLLERDSVLSFEYETAQFTEIGGMA